MPLAPDLEMAASQPVKPAETFTFKASHFYAVLGVFAFGIGILVGYVVWGRAALTAAPVAAQVAAPAAPVETPTPQYVRYKIPTDGSPSLGPDDAPITLVEFADPQCPYCAQWSQQTFPELVRDYVRPGQKNKLTSKAIAEL
jgi:protein-disulfide isomerase